MKTIIQAGAGKFSIEFIFVYKVFKSRMLEAAKKQLPLRDMYSVTSCGETYYEEVYSYHLLNGYNVPKMLQEIINLINGVPLRVSGMCSDNTGNLLTITTMPPNNYVAE